ncbi:MAG: 50S ribosomal protein L21 [Candidatus Omnitrophota bacterium]
MYAIVEVGAKQYTIKEGDIINVELIGQGKAKSVELNKVLLIADKDDIKIGKPYIKDAKIKAEVKGDFRAKKVIAFKFRRRKSSSTKRGHRQNLTRLLIKEIINK